MRIAIAMRTFDEPSSQRPLSGDCFAEFEVHDARREPADGDEDVQVTVVLRGRRAELENPALRVTELVLRAVERQDRRRASSDVIDVSGIAVEVSPGAG
jgi:hypothetical protein